MPEVGALKGVSDSFGTMNNYWETSLEKVTSTIVKGSEVRRPGNQEGTLLGIGYNKCDRCSVTTGGDHRSVLFGQTCIVNFQFVF